MQIPNDDLNNQNQPLAIPEADLRVTISKAFDPIFSSFTPEELSNEIELFLQGFPITEPQNQEASFKPVLPGLKPKTFRAILKSDFQLFPQLTDIAIAASYTITLGSLKPVLLSGLIKLIYNYLQKGIALSYEQGIVLKVIKDISPPGLTLESISQQTNLPLEQVKEALESLQCVYKPDDSKVELARETNGRWAGIGL